ncbi:fibropellin-3-like isoform X1 [Montipora capricornis]|uniref:fibropellin-3-like isoform X1 n=1 Tax=Montipora capricornis TaxID=246305 RepID=UPI0035F117BE
MSYLALLTILGMLDICFSQIQCRTATDWSTRFDKKGWTNCANTEYVTGFYRNTNGGSNDQIYLLEHAKCCKAPTPNEKRPQSCSTADWWRVLDSNKKWAVCPNGRFIQGLYRNSGGWLHHIEEARCCKPNNLPSSYLHCYDKDVGLSFDKKGWSVCDGDYYMAGFYKGNCDKLYCIEKFKCCSMKEGDCKMADWWKAFDKKGWVTCDSSKHYITGLFRNNNRGSNDKISLLEEAKCCPAPAPDQTMGSTCKTVDWWKVLDKTKSWAVCPDGYFIQGFYRNSGDWVHHIEEAKCCKPRNYPSRYETCYHENIVASFDNIGLSGCKRYGYYLAGIYRGGCDFLGCIEYLKCCKMNVDECRISYPCKNGGRCLDMKGSYICICKSGYKGKNCKTDINECSNNPCKNGATCVNLKESYRCDCKSGYTGTKCQTDVDECSNNPCKNGATCVNLKGSYRCDCKSGYTGSKCETDVDECSNNPCKNGATCVNLKGSYQCDCKSGYTGSKCETDVDECSNNPCKNGATCVNLKGSYRCDCKPGYTGSKCQTDVDECSNNPCKNGATCVNLKGSYRCDCKPGYTGSKCQTDVNECSPNPCQHGATCVDLVGSYRCDCKSGYTGNNCETDISECSPNPCQNGGTCVDLIGSYRCDCKSGYTGNNCQTDINECSPNPCLNGATCVDLVGSHRCDCKSGYTGSSCETDINKCNTNPCQNGGTCVDLVSSYRCNCVDGFLGVNCEFEDNDECEM